MDESSPALNFVPGRRTSDYPCSQWLPAETVTPFFSEDGLTKRQTCHYTDTLIHSHAEIERDRDKNKKESLRYLVLQW